MAGESVEGAQAGEIFNLVVAQVMHLRRFFKFWFFLLVVDGLRGAFFSDSDAQP